MLFDWIASTPLGNETFLEVWEWVQISYNAFIIFTVFRFTFHVLRGAMEEFIERSRLFQFIFRWWRPILAAHLIYYTLTGAYSNWFSIALFLVAFVVVTINLILQFSIERLERKIKAYEDMRKEREKKKDADENTDDDNDDDDDDDDDRDDRDRDRDGNRDGD